ncbi:DEAD/DEAH box helicase family protein [Tritrichomonas foetus]|uniref:ATP-dependent RNA helicase n=1 Tax=Tritrichomonas foetus TaxID=1144522 RepID=A0A1J4JET1_9EUKA|nr:DEAD/DEAH box helicase family protein [Tritrichomonas foetus]|eukprot:OHS96807.1 DEAD/DEAH box helicase family protein [Tritrichomonas foetus]
MSRRYRSRDQRREETQRNRRLFQEELDSINDRLNNIALNNYIDNDLTDEFSSLPIFETTKEALTKKKFVKMSPIQKQSLLYTLCGRDLIGAAETGTGKTLAFLIPLIETLKKSKWSVSSGLGAIIISPTRDLASQTYNVLADLITDTGFSAGLVTGGLHFEEAEANLGQLNIMICTPGRLKEHVDNSPQFNADNLQILVLDEADRLLGTEFVKDLKQIIREFPKNRQTLLFTATAGKAIKSLSKLWLQNPVSVLITEKRESATPDNLVEFYTIVPLSEKFNTLFSFLRSHKSDKLIVFMETVKMVRFAFEAFRHLKPGLPLMHLTGKQSSELRFSVCRDFANKERGVIFTTDVAARGLDFPQVNWVIQMDCPTTTETYIHRVGRTARFYQGGKGLLFLTPSEKAFVTKMAENKVNLRPIQIQESELINIKPELVDVLAKFSDVKHLAIKAFTTYLKSVQRHNDGEVFKLDEVLKQKDDFAKAFGLLGTPVITKVAKGKKENTENKGDNKEENSENDENEKQSDTEEIEPFFKIVPDDNEEDESEAVQKKELQPQNIRFLNPDQPITEEEYHAWREYLHGLFIDQNKPKHQKKQQKKKGQNAAENENDENAEPELSLEEQAERALLSQLE